MRRVNKILIAVVAVGCVCFVLAAAVVAVFGKKIIEAQLEQNLKVDARIGGIGLSLPLTVTVTDLTVGNLLTVEKLSFSLNPLGFLAGKILLTTLVLDSPVITLEQSADGHLNLPVFPSGGNPAPVLLTGLLVKNGTLLFTDKKVIPQGYTVGLDQITLTVSKVMVPPTSLNVKCAINAAVVAADRKPFGLIEAKGWVDLGPKDMQGNIVVKDLEVTRLAPYYGDFFSKRKLRSGILNLFVELSARHNAARADCHLQLSKLTYASGGAPQEQSGGQELFSRALDLFADEKGAIEFDYALNFSLDNPRVDLKTLQKAMWEAAAKNIARQNPQQVIDKVQDTLEQFKAIGKQMKGIFKYKEE
ncbi:MAG: DUF748 domain-containing protein [Candidatus Omnitrophica bacterium]|nr:DUF748 domain-containing protein [Candidatus Omnitrophota bacterium]